MRELRITLDTPLAAILDNTIVQRYVRTAAIYTIFSRGITIA